MAYTDLEQDFGWLRNYFKLKPANGCVVGTRGLTNPDGHYSHKKVVSTEEFCAMLKLCRKAYQNPRVIVRDEKRKIAGYYNVHGMLQIKTFRDDKKDFLEFIFDQRTADNIIKRIGENDFRWIQKVKDGTVKRNKWVTK